MHITPWTDGITDAMQEVDRTFLQQSFGPIANGRVQAALQDNRSQGPTENTYCQNVEACKQKKEGNNSMSTEQRRPRDLYWVTEDMTAIQQVDNIEEAMEIIAGKIIHKKIERK